MDRRAIFFFGAALAAALLAPVTEAEHQWVPIAVAVTYVVLGIASWADRSSRQRPRPGSDL